MFKKNKVLCYGFYKQNYKLCQLLAFSLFGLGCFSYFKRFKLKFLGGF